MARAAFFVSLILATAVVAFSKPFEHPKYRWEKKLKASLFGNGMGDIGINADPTSPVQIFNTT